MCGQSRAPEVQFRGDEILWEIERFVKGNEAPLPDDKPSTAMQCNGGGQAKGVLQAFEGWHWAECHTDAHDRGVRRTQLPVGRFYGGLWATRNRGCRALAIGSAERADE